MIKIAVFGAIGRAGRSILSLALTQGMEVTAYARRAADLDLWAGRMRIVQGTGSGPNS